MCTVEGREGEKNDKYTALKAGSLLYGSLPLIMIQPIEFIP